MGRYDKYKQLRNEEIEFDKEQELLHKKHGLPDNDTVIVEKSNTFKFTLSFLKNFIKTAASIIFIILAAIGIITLLYPEIRIEFFYVINQIFLQIKSMV